MVTTNTAQKVDTYTFEWDLSSQKTTKPTKTYKAGDTVTFDIPNKKRSKSVQKTAMKLFAASVGLFLTYNATRLSSKANALPTNTLETSMNYTTPTNTTLEEKAAELFSTSPNDFIPNVDRNTRLKNIMKSDALIQKIEKEYGIQEGLLAGWAAREYGIKFPLNTTNDGGAGAHIHFQPGTAQHFGQKTYGTSKATGADKEHGKQLDSLAKALNYNMKELAKYDDRFNEEKNLDAAAQYLLEEYRKHNSWNKALRAVNAGTPGKNYLESRHNWLSREYQRQVLLERKKQGISVNEQLLSDIHDITAYMFTEEGNNQYSHIALLGDSIQGIISRFEKVTGKDIDETNLYTKSGKQITNKNLRPEQTVYIKL